MRVYHGTTMIVEHPLVNVGRKNLDFGNGFYLTDLEEQAVLWASRPINKGKRQFVNEYEFDIDAALNGEFRYLKFDAYNLDWLNFVVSNRKGGNEWTQYDIIEGGIANDRVFNTIELYSDGLISDKEALQSLIYEKPNNQICLLNQTIIDRHIRFIQAKELQI